MKKIDLTLERLNHIINKKPIGSGQYNNVYNIDKELIKLSNKVLIFSNESNSCNNSILKKEFYKEYSDYFGFIELTIDDVETTDFIMDK